MYIFNIFRREKRLPMYCRLRWDVKGFHELVHTLLKAAIPDRAGPLLPSSSPIISSARHISVIALTPHHTTLPTVPLTSREPALNTSLTRYSSQTPHKDAPHPNHQARKSQQHHLQAFLHSGICPRRRGRYRCNKIWRLCNFRFLQQARTSQREPLHPTEGDGIAKAPQREALPAAQAPRRTRQPHRRAGEGKGRRAQLGPGHA